MNGIAKAFLDKSDFVTDLELLPPKNTAQKCHHRVGDGSGMGVGEEKRP
jgi:hypothetical protein